MINMYWLYVELSPMKDVLHVPYFAFLVARLLLDLVYFKVVEVGSGSNEEANNHELDGCEHTPVADVAAACSRDKYCWNQAKRS